MRAWLLFSSVASSLAFNAFPITPVAAASDFSPSYLGVSSSSPVATTTSTRSSCSLARSPLSATFSSSKRRGGAVVMAAVEASVSAGEGSGVGDNSAVALKGGAVSKSDAFEAGARPSSPGGLLIMAWGCLGVAYILFNPIKRLAPLAMLPWSAGADSPHFLGPMGWAAYAAFVGFMGYAEGYMGFQTKFSPLVVARSADLANSRPEAGLVGFLKWCAKVAMAPFYGMGLFHASGKRLKVSWGMVFGISAIVALCKKVPAPWRSVVDGGVVVGLTWGLTSILCLWLRTLLTGAAPPVDLQLPEKKKKAA